MDFPADPPRRAAIPEGLPEALGAMEYWRGRLTRTRRGLIEYK